MGVEKLPPNCIDFAEYKLKKAHARLYDEDLPKLLEHLLRPDENENRKV